jgi:PAS domain S-box-containing protein
MRTNYSIDRETTSAELREENARLLERIRELETELEEPLSTMHAIRQGLVDAVVIDRDTEPEIMTLESASEMYLRLAQQAAKVGTWQWNLATNEIVGSEMFWALLGETPRALANFSAWEQHIASEERDQFTTKVQDAAEHDSELCYELKIITPSGESRCLDTRGRVLHSANVGKRMLVGICLDITARKNAEEALREADRHKDEFLATLAHELRNPLAPIRNAIDTLRLSGSADLATERTYETLEQQIANLVRIVDDLLEVARISTGKIHIRKELVGVKSIVKGAIDTSRPLIDAAGHELFISLPDQPISLEGDPVRLCQVISNLLNNAAKYTPPKGKIWLTVSQEADQVAISVRDSGSGIPAEMLSRVFKMFTQLDRDKKQAQGGLGIGLALAKSLVDLHGGNIEVHSEGAGQGSEFIVHLPRAKQQSPQSRAQLRPHLKSTANSCRIMVVDDHAAGATMLAKLLENMGNEVRVADGGRAALAALSEWQPDVLLLDIGMPEMDGYEVANRIRQQPELDGILLVALTGWGQTDDRRRTEEAGFDHHLVKPVDIESLRRLLSSVNAADCSSRTPS